MSSSMKSVKSSDTVSKQSQSKPTKSEVVSKPATKVESAGEERKSMSEFGEDRLEAAGDENMPTFNSNIQINGIDLRDDSFIDETTSFNDSFGKSKGLRSSLKKKKKAPENDLDDLNSSPDFERFERKRSVKFA